MSPFLADASATVLSHLGRATLSGGLFIALVALLVRAAPRLPAGVRCGLWWLACLKLLIGLAWMEPIRLPLLPAALSLKDASAPALSGLKGRTVIAQGVALGRDVTRGSCGLKGRAECPSPGAAGPAKNATAGRDAVVERQFGSGWEREARASAPVPIAPSSWRLGLLVLWLTGLGLELGLLGWGLWQSGRLIRRAAPVSEPTLLGLFGRLANRLGLRREPGFRLSAEVQTPQALGSLRPQILLPLRRLGALTPAEVEMTLCHELVHVRRGDLWLAWVPALAQRLFFFFPPAAWAAREYLVAREAACDAEVLRVLGSAPQAYGRLLLQWGVAPRETGLAAAGASPSLVNLKRRLQMLHETTETSRRSRLRWGLAGALALVALIPFTIVAQTPAPEAPDAPAVADLVDPADAVEAVEATEPTDAFDAPEATEPSPAPEAEEAGAPAPAAEAGEADEAWPAVAGTPVAAPAAAAAPEAPGSPVPRPAGTPAPARAPRAVPAVPGVAAPTPAPARAPRAVPMVPGLAAPTPAPAPRALPAVPGVAAPAPARAPRAIPAVAPARALGAPVAVAAPTPPRARIAGRPGEAAMVVAHAAPPAPPRPPAAPPAPPTPKAGKSGTHRSYSNYDGGKGGDAWVYLSGDDTSMNGSSSDLAEARKVRGSGRVLWFKRGGKAYVVRDAATLERIESLWKPVGELGGQMGTLGEEMGKLGEEMGKLGEKMGALGAQQGALGAKMGAASSRHARSEGDDARYERESEELGRKMEELGRQQEALGEQQEVVGRQQEALGKKQEEASQKAEAELDRLMESSLRSGLAQPAR